MSNSYILGIDLGGTKIAAAAFDLAGKRLGKIARLPTMAAMQPAVTLMNLKRAAKQAAAEAGLDGPPAAVGMGSTGPLDLRNQVLLDKDSLPRLVGFPIGKFVAEELGAPLYLENDAACFALGEARQGAGRGASVVVGITLGTVSAAASSSMDKCSRAPATTPARSPTVRLTARTTTAHVPAAA